MTKVAPKIKYFMWRLFQGILFTRMRLRDKGIILESECVVCGTQRESIKHLFLECKMSKVLWNEMDPKLLVQGDCIRGNLQSWEHVMIRLQEKDLIENGMYAFWLLWHNRNDCLHNMKCWNPDTLRLIAFKMANDYYEASAVVSTATQQNIGEWIPPLRYCYKINVDAAFNASFRITSLGVVSRNDESLVDFSALSKISGV